MREIKIDTAQLCDVVEFLHLFFLSWYKFQTCKNKCNTFDEWLLRYN